MMNLGRPPLPLNKPHRQQFNYHDYVKDFDLDARLKVFKATIRTNGEIEDVDIINSFSFTLGDIMSD